uniref:Ig-like domain-containing protein n=1 Tax=Tetraodon nigroviridis TaxID=99883 RepID=H3C8I1_TETNG
NLGQDQLLSCQLVNTVETTFTKVSVTWEKTGMQGFVYQYVNGGSSLGNQNKEFSGRTDIFPDELLKGNVSLLLRSARAEDEGVYTCSADSSKGGGKVNIHLRTAAYTAPTFTLSERTMTARADRWFPRPNVTWTDSNRRVLQATTSMEESSAGIFRVVSSLPEVNSSQSYTLQIKNPLVMSTSSAEITGILRDERQGRTSKNLKLSFSRAPPALASFYPSVVATVACISFLMYK